MSFDRSIFIGKFTQEAKELIQKLNTGLIQLEKDPKDHNVIKEILRAAHTLKGTSKIVRFNNVNQLSHKIEDLLIAVQDGQLTLTGNIIDLLFRSTDLIGQSVEGTLKGEGEAVEITAIHHALECAANGEDVSGILSQLPPLGEQKASVSTEIDESSRAREVDTLPKRLPNLPLQGVEQSSQVIIQPPASEDSTSEPKLQETIRVGVDKVDNAVRLVGELAVGRKKSEHTLSILKELQRVARRHAKRLRQMFQGNHLELPKELQTELIDESLQLLKGIENTFKEGRDEVAMREIAINELHEDVLKMRMLPLSIVFDTFPRAVRDMAQYFNKQIELRITGEDTTLDKKIIEKLDGPLIHILRNCVDHGIELPEKRIAQGKPATGLITITAYHRSGHIKIEICDDGRGIQLEKLKQRAIQRGILSEEKARTLGDAELLNLVFLPRISTSEIITDISGRGVGMDIVKANIEQLKGSVSLSSKPGRGTSCVLMVPLTLTTLHSLIISSQNKLFAVPINLIEETLQIPSHEFIQVVGHNAIRLRNQIIYVLNLADVLGLVPKKNELQEQHFVLIARVDGKRVGLIVDGILDEQDVVVKQLPIHMQKVKTIAGATISSDNTIILILHIPEIVELVKQVTIETRKDRPAETEAIPPRILVVDDSINTGEIEKRILESCGYQVDLAKDGVEAIEQVENVRYDLIVTDIEMPRMDGFTLTEELRNMPRYADVPIVIVTSRERETDKKRGLQVGANAYIMKGDFEQRSLIETVKSLV